MDLHSKIPEYQDLESILSLLKGKGEFEVLGEVACGSASNVPVYGLTMGSQDPMAPVLALFGGVHGLERIGSQVVLSYLRYLLEYLKWDQAAEQMLKSVRIVAIPLINPYGFWHHRRSNENGVDLMRNAPVEGDPDHVQWLLGGHRYGSWLPWYRGELGAKTESQVEWVTQFFEKHTKQSRFVISLDAHSGFGYKDRLWFPYAKTQAPFPHLGEVFRFRQILDDVMPYHVYHLEPQSLSYCTHGDLWDYLYDRYRDRQPKGIFLPLTLEMGSWLWVKKNPSQFFSKTGPFNPVVDHRLRRVLRRHLLLYDLLLRLCGSHQNWLRTDDLTAQALQMGARALWYPPRIPKK